MQGWVRVGGVVIRELGTRVDPRQIIEIDRSARSAQSKLVTVVLNKPVGYVSAPGDDGYPVASSLIRVQARWDRDPDTQPFSPLHRRGLAPAGRLDIDSTGLLLLTQDGRIARRVIGQDSEVEKEYLVRVSGRMIPEGLDYLRHGLELDAKALLPARVSWQNDDQLRFVLREGKKRQIRRMCELVGLKVVGLKRIRIGGVVLGTLPLGQWRYLRPDEQL